MTCVWNFQIVSFGACLETFKVDTLYGKSMCAPLKALGWWENFPMQGHGLGSLIRECDIWGIAYVLKSTR